MFDKSLFLQELKSHLSPAQQIDEVQWMAQRSVGIEGKRQIDIDPLYLVNFLLVGDEKDSLLSLHHKLIQLLSCVNMGLPLTACYFLIS